MDSYYNQNYTKEQITQILAKIKHCVKTHRFTISRNEHRQENIDFINEYNIRSEKQVPILLQIQPDDFCHSLQNTNAGFEHEVLYVFVPQIQLFRADGEEETVDIYTKFNLIESSDNSRTVVISFHKRNKAIHYRFGEMRLKRR